MAAPECDTKVSSCHSTLVRSGTVSEEVPLLPLQPPMAESIHTASASGPSRGRESLAEPLVDGHVAHDTGPRRLPSPDCGIGRPGDVLIRMSASNDGHGSPPPNLRRTARNSGDSRRSL